VNPDLFLTYFNRISDVPDAPLRLRTFILDLAIRGKLVDRISSDEPVTHLLERIREAKTGRASSRPAKDERPFPQVKPDQFPFGIPASWCCVRLGAITEVVMGQSPPGETYNKSGEGVPLINGPVEFTDGPFGKTVINQYTTAPTNFCEEGDLLLCVRGSTTGRTNIAGFRACIGRGVAAIRPYFADRYVRLFIWRQRASIIAMGRGIAFPSISKQQIEDLLIPLPPLPEQHRIAAKVDELMALCDRLEAAQRNRESGRDLFTSATHHHLTSGVDAQNLHEFAEFFVDHLPSLTTRPHQIKQLRQTILQLAIRGQLVAQNSKDESAKEFLNKIRAKKEVLLRKGEIKKEKISKVSANGGKLFEIPPSWEWVSLGDVAFSFKYGTSVKCSYEAEGEPVLRIPNIRGGQIDLQDMKYGPLSEREVNDLSLRLGDLLMVRSNGSLDLVGRAAIVDAAAVGYCYAGYLVRVRTDVELVDTRYLLLALTTRYVRDQIEIPIRSAVGLKNVNTSELSSLTFPIAPLAEQHRIVARVDELMTICDSLESQINEVQTKASSLLESVLFDSLANTESVGSGHQAIRA